MEAISPIVPDLDSRIERNRSRSRDDDSQVQRRARSRDDHLFNRSRSRDDDPDGHLHRSRSRDDSPRSFDPDDEDMPPLPPPSPDEEHRFLRSRSRDRPPSPPTQVQRGRTRYRSHSRDDGVERKEPRNTPMDHRHQRRFGDWLKERVQSLERNRQRQHRMDSPAAGSDPGTQSRKDEYSEDWLAPPVVPIAQRSRQHSAPPTVDAKQQEKKER